MSKAIVVYESKYGNTRHAAETIIQGIKEVEGIDVDLSEAKNVDYEKLAGYDIVLVGSPNHFGGPTRGINKFIDEVGKLNLTGKEIAVFDTYQGKDFEKAVKKMEKRISEKACTSTLVTPGLSIRVQGMKGPISDEELSKCKEFGGRIANQIRA